SFHNNQYMQTLLLWVAWWSPILLTAPQPAPALSSEPDSLAVELIENCFEVIESFNAAPRDKRASLNIRYIHHTRDWAEKEFFIFEEGVHAFLLRNYLLGQNPDGLISATSVMFTEERVQALFRSVTTMDMDSTVITLVAEADGKLKGLELHEKATDQSCEPFSWNGQSFQAWNWTDPVAITSPLEPSYTCTTKAFELVMNAYWDSLIPDDQTIWTKSKEADGMIGFQRAVLPSDPFFGEGANARYDSVQIQVSPPLLAYIIEAADP
ncbi:MAG: hypothetical protein AAFV07_17010, partial [Bacteroidota bacterium]